MKPSTLPQSFIFPVPTAFYPECGSDISFLPELLEKGVRIFFHCDNIGLPRDKFPESIQFNQNEADLVQAPPILNLETDYRNNLLETIRKLREEDYKPKVVEQGNLFHEMGGINVVHELHYALHAMPDTEMEKKMLLPLPPIWFSNWHMLKVHDPMSKEPFVILMMNAEALCILKFLFETQCPDYLTIGGISWINLEDLHWTLRSIALIHGSSMPVIHSPKNQPNPTIGESYGDDHYKDAWIPNPETWGEPENRPPGSERPIQFPLTTEIREIFLNLKMLLIQALNMEHTLPWISTGHSIQMPLPEPTKVPLEETETNFNNIVDLFISKRANDQLNRSSIKMNNTNRGPCTLERWCENSTGEILREKSVEAGAVSSCGRYYLPSKELYGEEYSTAGWRQESRIVKSKPLLTNHSAQPGIIQNLKPILLALREKIQTMEDATNFSDTIQEFLNLTNDLNIHVFPVTHHERNNIRKTIRGFSAIVRFTRPDGKRIAEVSYLNARVSGCVRMYNESDNLKGEIYVNMGRMVRYNYFLLPTKITK